MKVLVDVDVIKNYLNGYKEEKSEVLDQIAEMCSQHKIEGYIAFHSLHIIWYFAKKRETDAKSREWLKCILNVLHVASARHEALAGAVYNPEFRDFEDNLQECCAVSAGCDYIVTVNVKDYEHSRVPAVTPSELIQIINKLYQSQQK